MKLMVIEGGRAAGGEGRPPPKDIPPGTCGLFAVAGSPGLSRLPAAADVHAEARRRIRLSGHDICSLRSFATGIPIPTALRYLQLQIAFSAEALAKIDPIPDDFRSDIYWPSG